MALTPAPGLLTQKEKQRLGQPILKERCAWDDNQDIRPVNKITLSEAMERYLSQVSTTKRPNSERRDRDSAKAILNIIGTDISLADLSPQHIVAFRDKRLTHI